MAGKFDLKLEVQNANKIQQAMDELKSNLIDYGLPQTLEDVMNLALQEGQRGAPVRTGFLRNSGQITKQGKLSITLEFTASYAAATNENHPTKAGWFDKAVTFVENTLPVNVDREAREQAGIASRKIGG